MMKIKKILMAVALLGMIACDGEEQQVAANNKVLQEVIQQEELEPINIEPQDVFDESQMNSKALGLCVKFKILKGADRGHIFKLIESILPTCPMKILEDDSIESDPLSAQQRMSLNDLKEILGGPDEIRDNGLIVYNLSKNSRVIFLAEPDGTVSCRTFEGMG